MNKRQSTASIVASPVLVGAVTVLISVIAVFIAYNANSGLPFVPTYDIKAELPSGNKLVEGNEVRAGGFRVGVVKQIEPKTVMQGGKPKAIAEVSLKLDKVIEPLATDTRLEVRPRSALGLKYVQLTPGRGRRSFTPGDTVPLANSREGLELEDLFSTFNPETRRNSQAALEGFGDAFAARGASLNAAIQALSPLFRELTPVMRNLSRRDTELDRFFLQLGRSAAQVAPVAEVQARLFTNMADTFEAVSRDPGALQATIEKSPPTEDVAIRSFRVQRPFLADFADLSRRLRPAVGELPRSLPAINSAFRVGTEVLPDTVELNGRLRGALVELEDLFENPSTLLTLRDLGTALEVTRPALEFIVPYQTVCNYAVYFMNALGEHQSQPAPGGTIQNQGAKTANPMQENTLGNTESSRPWDVPLDQDPRGAKDSLGEPLGRDYNPGYHPAIDAQGNADCELGQTGYVRRFQTQGRYRPGDPEGGGNYPVSDSNIPLLSGGTYKSRELGIDHLADVP
jgi:virulence factor Mce-like protein